MNRNPAFPLSTVGLIGCFTFVILDSVRAVFFGSVFQHTDAFLVGTCVFGVSTAASLAWTLYPAPAQLVTAFCEQRLLIGLNLTAASGWLA